MNDDNFNDESLMRSLRRLPEAIEPGRDLWAGIAAGIAAEAGQAPAAARDRANRWNAGLGLAAGLAGIAIGALTAYFIFGRPQLPDGAAGALTAAQNAEPATANLPVSLQPRALPAAFGPDYLKARNALLSRLTTQLQSLPAADQAKVKAAIQEIDSGLNALNEALAQSPDSVLLQQLVLSAYQRQLQTLQDITDATAIANGDTHT